MAKVLVLAESADAQRALAAGARTIGDEVVLVAVGAAEAGVADKAYQVEVPAGAVADDEAETLSEEGLRVRRPDRARWRLPFLPERHHTYRHPPRQLL